MGAVPVVLLALWTGALARHSECGEEVRNLGGSRKPEAAPCWLAKMFTAPGPCEPGDQRHKCGRRVLRDRRHTRVSG